MNILYWLQAIRDAILQLASAAIQGPEGPAGPAGADGEDSTIDPLLWVGAVSTIPVMESDGRTLAVDDVMRLAFDDGSFWYGDLGYICLSAYAEQPMTTSGQAYLLPITGNVRFLNWRAVVFVAGTNDADDYWELQLNKDGGATVATLTTQNLAGNTDLALNDATARMMTGIAGYIGVRLNKVGAPGPIYVAISARPQYRF